MASKSVLILASIGLSLGLQLTDKSYSPCLTPTTIQAIDVSPCSAEPCAFTRGTTVNIKADFTPHEASSGCVVEMSANMGGWIPVIKEQICGNGLTCPLSANAKNQLNYVHSVSDALPAGPTLTRWKLVCDNAATEVFCADVNIVVN